MMQALWHAAQKWRASRSSEILSILPSAVLSAAPETPELDIVPDEAFAGLEEACNVH